MGVKTKGTLPYAEIDKPPRFAIFWIFDILKMLQIFKNIFSQLRARSVSLATSGLFLSSKGVWRGPGRPKLVWKTISNFMSIFPKKVRVPTFLWSQNWQTFPLIMLIQIIDGNCIFSNLLADVPPRPKVGKRTPPQIWGAEIMKNELNISWRPHCRPGAFKHQRVQWFLDVDHWIRWY